MQNKEWFFTVACFGAIRKNAEILFSFPMKILQKTVRFLPKPPSEYEPFFLFPSETEKKVYGAEHGVQDAKA